MHPGDEQWTPTTYGQQWAADYDRMQAPPPDETSAAIATLVQLAARRPVLELAAGTGRIAIPLAAHGLDVTAADISPEMLAVLAAGDPTASVTCRVQDMTEPGEPRFGLVALLLHSLFWVIEPEHQQAVFRAAASHLEPGGLFVTEMFVRDFSTWAPLWRGEPPCGGGAVLIREGVWEPTSQRLTNTFHVLDGERVSRRQVELRLVWPAECDLMAAAAGLVVEERWSDWHRTPFGPGSADAVTVYRKPA